MSTDYSRGLRLATISTGEPNNDLRSRIESTRVVVSADPDSGAHFAAVRVLVANLRRLPIELHIDPTGGSAALDAASIEALAALADGIDPDRPLRIGRPFTCDLHLHVGASGNPAAISAVPHGHGVSLRRAGHPFAPLRAEGSGLGAVLTGATLTAEAFKTIVGVAPNRHRLLDTLDFCPVSLGQPGPAMPLREIGGTALVGAGAIGTAVALILRELETSGTLTVVDPQVFEGPNVTTYSLGNRHDAEQALEKARLLQRELPLIDVEPLRGTARDFINAIDAGNAPMPAIVLGAVDSIEARHEIAALHAALTLDGSTGGRTGTTLSLAEALPTGPCLRCYYPGAFPNGTSVEQKLATTTGLSLERIARGDEPLTAAELAALPTAKRAVLVPHVGKPVCGLARSLGLTGAVDDYQPSAAFVAQQAAALVVGALIRRSINELARMHDVEYDAMFGPHQQMVEPRLAKTSCRCQVDADVIAAVRARRYA